MRQPRRISPAAVRPELVEGRTALAASSPFVVRQAHHERREQLYIARPEPTEGPDTVLPQHDVSSRPSGLATGGLRRLDLDVWAVDVVKLQEQRQAHGLPLFIPAAGLYLETNGPPPFLS